MRHAWKVPSPRAVVIRRLARPLARTRFNTCMRSSARAGVASPGGLFRREYQAVPVSRATVKRVWASFDSFRPQVAVICATVLVSALLSRIPAVSLKYIINQGLVGRNYHAVAYWCSISLVAAFVSTGFGLYCNYLSIAVGQDVMRDYRDRLYTHLQKMSLRFFTDTRTGEIQSRLSNDVSGVQSVVSDTVANLVSNLANVISSLALMIVLDWRLTLLSVGVLPIIAWIGTRVGLFARKVRSTTQQQLADLNATMQETLSISGILLTKTSGRQALALERFQHENRALTDSQVKQSMVMRVFFNLIGLTFNITPVLVYWLAGYLIDHNIGNLSLGTVVSFITLQAGLFFPLQGLLNSQVDVTSSFALFDRIFEYLDLEPDVLDDPDAIALSPSEVRGAVGFEHVVFRYDEDQKRPTLSDVTFDAKPGELVALVGHSGAGKTTLTYLIPRLYDADAGRVTIDGRDVRKIKIESLSHIVGVVTQETYLVHDTLRENLRYGKPEATDEELAEAARVAAIHDHIMSLPQGYDTIVGERGYKLSGGEKQRIAIARAVLKNPRILILDEATSSLDTRSERLVQAALEPLMRGRTTFAIAHRLSTILAADRIVVMDAGKVVEQGTHSDLLAADGHYATLYRMQFSDSPDPETVDDSDDDEIASFVEA
jgi:ATP-binding cassette subfamily B protein